MNSKIFVGFNFMKQQFIMKLCTMKIPTPASDSLRRKGEGTEKEP